MGSHHRRHHPSEGVDLSESLAQSHHTTHSRTQPAAGCRQQQNRKVETRVVCTRPAKRATAGLVLPFPTHTRNTPPSVRPSCLLLCLSQTGGVGEERGQHLGHDASEMRKARQNEGGRRRHAATDTNCCPSRLDIKRYLTFPWFCGILLSWSRPDPDATLPTARRPPPAARAGDRAEEPKSCKLVLPWVGGLGWVVCLGGAGAGAGLRAAAGLGVLQRGLCNAASCSSRNQQPMVGVRGVGWVCPGMAVPSRFLLVTHTRRCAWGEDGGDTSREQRGCGWDPERKCAGARIPIFHGRPDSTPRVRPTPPPTLPSKFQIQMTSTSSPGQPSA